jgi:hypothetical protein
VQIEVNAIKLQFEKSTDKIGGGGATPVQDSRPQQHIIGDSERHMGPPEEDDSGSSFTSQSNDPAAEESHRVKREVRK